MSAMLSFGRLMLRAGLVGATIEAHDTEAEAVVTIVAQLGIVTLGGKLVAVAVYSPDGRLAAVSRCAA